MNTGSQKRLLVDAALFIGFIVCFFLDLTGVSLHQWLGLAVGIVAAYHLITHHNWVGAVTRRFFASTSDQARIYYLLDAALLAGFLTIFGTGLVISTWLGLALSDYSAWFALHAIASVVTLIVLVAKIWLHARWIVSTFKKRSPVPRPVMAPTNLPAQNRMARRDFIKLMGAVGTASVFAAGTTLHSLGEFAGSTDESPSASTSTTNTLASSTSSGANSSSTGSNSSTCAVRCNRRCAYPGHCRRYTDSNNSGRCDFGECLS